jgi:hypothetical protein
MLIDQILADPNWWTRRGMTGELCGRLSKATKFVLRSDFAIAADQFRNDLDSLERGRQFCRLPFSECWIESIRKNRIGYLLTQTDHDGSFEGRKPHSTSFDTAYTHREICSTQFSRDELSRFWQGEPRYLTAVLELLQSKNATDVSSLVDLSRVNHQRARRNKPLLFSYHVVSIPARYRARYLAAGSGREIRAHYVRGHFKVRRTGIFFWSAYQRGNPALGFVHKDYVLARPRAAA